MKTESIIVSILWVVMSGIPQVSQADDRAVMQGIMDVMRTMQPSGGRDDPRGKAMMDMFDDAMSDRGGRRDQRDGRGEQRRRPGGYNDDDRPNRRGESQRRAWDDDDYPSRRGESQRRGRGYDDDDRPGRRGESQRRVWDDDDHPSRRGERQSGPRYGDSEKSRGSQQRGVAPTRPEGSRQRGVAPTRPEGSRQRGVAPTRPEGSRQRPAQD